jgi:aminopeptidase
MWRVKREREQRLQSTLKGEEGMFDWRDEELRRGIRNLFLNNLCVRREDKVLILTDTYKERVGELLFYFGSNLVPQISHLTYSPTRRHGIEPPEEVWRATFGEEFVSEIKEKELLEKILKKEISEGDELEVKELLLETTSPSELPTAVVAVNQFSISHTLYRKLCTEFLSVRFASMPLFEPFMFYTSLQANWNRVSRLSREIASLLTDAKEVHVTYPLGTDISFSVEGREGLADTGKICSPGDFGNLPAGEAFIAPVEGSAEGIFVTKYAPDRKLREPVRLTVKDGKVKNVEGEEEFSDFLTKLIHHEKNADNIAEFGIGTNERAERFDNILEAEKILGTCHIAIGDNSSFGGKVKANVHIDLLIDRATTVSYTHLTLPTIA